MSEKKNKITEDVGKKSFKKVDLLFCLLIVLVLFIPTLTRPWLIYDERIIYNNLYFPTPASFGNIFEIFSNFGSNFNIISSNSIYSSNYINRTCPLCLLMWMFTVFFLQKQPILFHLLNLSLHILNTILVYYILKISLGDIPLPEIALM